MEQTIKLKSDVEFEFKCGCRGRVDCDTGGVGMMMCALHLNAQPTLEALEALRESVVDYEDDPAIDAAKELADAAISKARSQ